ncbi:MAG: H4MPT-linked C1 transfer pathway protein [Gemmatimonadetes bacterium]|nr:H4MPT-linked C1 transfer pathway protein [Gemmatimonadota bacterium]
MKEPILGWDVGGANLKAARLGDGGATLEVVERPFALWREPHRLAEALAEVAGGLGGATRTMAVTMTAELADCFATKREGVAFVLDAFGAAFPGVDSRVYAVDGRFRSMQEATERPLEVAAANWMAAAALVARTSPDAVLLDVGSTTSDVIPIVAGRVAARGRTDPDRLASGELVYTGALRTPICAIVRSLPLGGRSCRVAAEHFAVAADVYRWLERIEDWDYTCDTPDGRGRSRPEAGARLARMVCADLEMVGVEDITAIAEYVARAQVRQIAVAIRQVRRRLGSTFPHLAVLAGQGAFLAEAAAQAAGLATRSLAAQLGPAARAAPAAAVALLLAETDFAP